jgi:hypothetical protein
MPSKSKAITLSQKSYYEAAFDKRLKELKDKGISEDDIQKNATLRHLKAKVRESNRRLRTIYNIEKKIAELAVRKAKKEEEKAEKGIAPNKKRSKGEKEKWNNLLPEQSDE